MTDSFPLDGSPPDGFPPARFSPDPPAPDAFPPELHDLLDGRLDEAAAEALRQRMAAEPTLDEAWSELRAIQTWVRADGPRGEALETPPALHAGIRARLTGLVAAGGAPGGDLAPEEAEGVDLVGEKAVPQQAVPQQAAPPRPARPSVFLRTLTLSYAAAALVVVGLSVVYVASMSGPQPPASEQASVEVPPEGTGEPAEGDVTRWRLEKQKSQAQSRADGGVGVELSERDDLDTGEGLGLDTGEGLGLDTGEGLGLDAGEGLGRLKEKGAKDRRRGASPESSDGFALPTKAPAPAASAPVPPTRAPSPRPVAGVGGGNSARGPFRGPGGSVQPKIRVPSDEPARPPAAEAPAPRRSKVADGEALDDKSSDDKSSGGGSVRRDRPARPPAAPRAPSTPSTGAPPKTAAKAPTYTDLRSSGAEKKSAGTLGRLERYLAAGDTIYVLETTDPMSARRELAALLDTPAAAPGGKAKKLDTSSASGARERPLGGGGGAKARAGAPDRLYRVQAAELASLGQRLDVVVANSLRVHSTLQREQTAEVLARLRSHLGSQAIGGTVDRPADGLATEEGRRGSSRGRKTRRAAGGTRQRGEKPAANSGAGADGDEEAPAPGVAPEEAKRGAPGSTRAKPEARQRTPRVRILILERAAPVERAAGGR